LCVIIVVWSVIQVIPFEASPWNNAVWDRVRLVIDTPQGTISASRYQPLHSVGYVLLPLAAFMSSLVYVRNEPRYMAFVYAILGTGILTTLFGVAQYFLSPRNLLWAEKRHYLDALTGTFVSPNSAATYFGVMLLLALAISFRQFERMRGSILFPDRGTWSARERRKGWVLAIYFAAVFTFSVALLLTKSRAGILSSLAGAASFSAAYMYSMMRRTMSLLKAGMLTLLFLAAATVCFALYSERVLRRIEIEGLADQARLCTYRSTWRAIEENFWRGTGLGTFQDVFPSFRTPECGLSGYWETAHNVFLEGWLGLGAIFPGCVLLAYTVLLATYLRGLRQRVRFRFIPLSCLAVLLIVSVHSLFDFSLQIPAIASLVAAILGAGAALSTKAVNLKTSQAGI